MRDLIVVDETAEWPAPSGAAELVGSLDYLSDPRFASGREPTKVVNLCGDHSYQSIGYYVSLLAAARGHRVTPSASAILWDPTADDAPSNRGALAKFEQAAEHLGVRAVRITADDYGRVPEFDALFIRETTSVEHHTYRFAQRAALEDPLDTDRLASIYRDVVTFGDRAVVEDSDYLGRLGLDRTPLPASEVWGRLLDTRGTSRPGSPWADDLALLLEQGPLARRLLRMLPPDPRREDLRSVAATLVTCLETNAPLRVA